jgi:hypothetical protein
LYSQKLYDPLGINIDVTFDEVLGGLDDRELIYVPYSRYISPLPLPPADIHTLREMTLLPLALLYPEVFQRFSVTPLLFHGLPGTGRTLLTRALAVSCRKGADCLFKWVCEAEHQLRLLFDEARNSQPSIIFFDEIDGLAPVRSSKQRSITCFNC